MAKQFVESDADDFDRNGLRGQGFAWKIDLRVLSFIFEERIDARAGCSAASGSYASAAIEGALRCGLTAIALCFLVRARGLFLLPNVEPGRK
jgi:hypothetical protein